MEADRYNTGKDWKQLGAGLLCILAHLFRGLTTSVEVVDNSIDEALVGLRSNYFTLNEDGSVG